MKCKVSVFAFILFSFLSFPALSQNFINASHGVQYRYIGTFDESKCNQILTSELASFLTYSTMKEPDFRGQFQKPRYKVRLYQVMYKSYVPELNNQPIMASGLVAVPENGLDSMPVISYQHGTVFSKTEVPSHPDESMETKMMLAQFASQGYIVIGADYFGMGLSSFPNAYLVKQSTEQACVDMLFAAQDVLKSLKLKQGPLFLHGWSQGGWNNMVFLRKLESLNIPVKAATTASAPLDGLGIIERWVNNYQPGDAIYLPGCATNFLFSYEYYNKMPGLTKRALKPEFYQIAKDFFEFKTDWFTYRSITKDKLDDILKDDFKRAGYIPFTDPFWSTLNGMEAYKWRTITPLINYYGEIDEVIPVEIAKLAEGYHKLVGAAGTRAVSAGPKADHRATYIYSVIQAKPFFDSFLKKK